VRSVGGVVKHGGAASLLSKRRGRPSNNRLPEGYRDLALSLVRERYADFGPTLSGSPAQAPVPVATVATPVLPA
jgi:hypothetical protein